MGVQVWRWCTSRRPPSSPAPSATRARVDGGADRLSMLEECRRRAGVVEERGGELAKARPRVRCSGEMVHPAADGPDGADGAGGAAPESAVIGQIEGSAAVRRREHRVAGGGGRAAGEGSSW